ncbi:MAG: hypothetical protein A4E73_02167 [Syntrophaceae bacterium PtaU1.Bin231]|nr:MAG: hypothetical protein A4E73_02167 [Syntrophaceae bacterium PtaU1.Bin231]
MNCLAVGAARKAPLLEDFRLADNILLRAANGDVACSRCILKARLSGRRPVLFVFVLIGTFILTGCNSGNPSPAGKVPKPATEYQAVFLDNGQVFFGKLEDSGAGYPLLKDVYYIQRQEDPATKQVRNVLVKRGSELHGPDAMYINTRHIVVIESITPDSKVAQLIRDAKAQKPAGTTP